MTTVEIQNPSAYNLRIASQDRVRNTFEKTATPAPTLKRSTRAELEKRGAAITMKPTRVSTRFSTEMRDCPVPLYQSLGYSSIEEYCTAVMEKELIASQQAVTAAPAVQHVVDSWADPKPFASVAPSARLTLPLDEGKRFLIESDDEVALQLSNTSSTRTIRLRNRDAKTGAVEHVAFIPPP